MAKPHSGPGYLVPFPDAYGGGTVVMRFLTLERLKAIRASAASDNASHTELRVIASIVEVSPDIAAAAGVVGELAPSGFVPVDDDPPGRLQVYEALGPQRRDLLASAWADQNFAKPEDVAPFLAGVSKVVF